MKRSLDLTLGNKGWLEVDIVPTIGTPVPPIPPALVMRVYGPAGGRLASILLTPVETGRLCGALLAVADDALGATPMTDAIRRAIEHTDGS